MGSAGRVAASGKQFIESFKDPAKSVQPRMRVRENFELVFSTMCVYVQFAENAGQYPRFEFKIGIWNEFLCRCMRAAFWLSEHPDHYKILAKYFLKLFKHK